MESNGFIKYNHKSFTNEEMISRSAQYFELMKSRRTVRQFSDEKIPDEVIENLIKTAGSAPSGANLQPWHFVVVTDKKIKKEIKLAVEKEEKEFYENKAPEEWLDALKALKTGWRKPFLETAPVLIVIFEKKYSIDENGKKQKHYYTKESVGIAAGFLISAVHNAGLVSLTHTPAPMKFLNKILNRPQNEKPFLILVAGKPAADYDLPDIKRKSIAEISTFM